jgi:hypothetical protein
MRILPVAFALGVAFAPVLAQEHQEADPKDQDCKQMISGIWTSKPGDGGKAVSVTYQPDGVYRQDGGSTDAADVEETGSWIAQTAAGKGSCDLTLTPTGGEPRTFTLTVVDHNTVKAEDGTISTRTEGTMEGHTSP